MHLAHVIVQHGGCVEYGNLLELMASGNLFDLTVGDESGRGVQRSMIGGIHAGNPGYLGSGLGPNEERNHHHKSLNDS